MVCGKINQMSTFYLKFIVFVFSVEGEPGLTASPQLTIKRVVSSELPLDFINSAKFEVRRRRRSEVVWIVSVYAFVRVAALCWLHCGWRVSKVFSDYSMPPS